MSDDRLPDSPYDRLWCGIRSEEKATRTEEPRKPAPTRETGPDVSGFLRECPTPALRSLAKHGPNVTTAKDAGHNPDWLTGTRVAFRHRVPLPDAARAAQHELARRKRVRQRQLDRADGGQVQPDELPPVLVAVAVVIAVVLLFA